jgi:hypothetical protein
MARWISLRDKLRKIQRQYPSVSPQRFFYKKPSDLRRAYSKILVWFLIHDEGRGYSVFSFQVKRGLEMSLSEWGALFRKKIHGYESIFRIFTQNVLPAINNKSGAAWRFKSLVGWTGIHDLPNPKNTDIPTKRKTAGKRNARKRHKYRRR